MGNSPHVRHLYNEINRNIILIFYITCWSHYVWVTVEISAMVCHEKAKRSYSLTVTYFQNVPIVLECTNCRRPFIKGSIKVAPTFTLLTPSYPSLCAIHLQSDKCCQPQVIWKLDFTERKMK